MSSLSLWLISSLKTCFLISLLKHKDWGSGRKGERVGGEREGVSVLRFSLENENIFNCMPIHVYKSVLIKRKYFFLIMKNMHSACKHVKWSTVISNWDKRGLWVMILIVTEKSRLYMDCPRLYERFWEKNE